jgi:hypothetical protein
MAKKYTKFSNKKNNYTVQKQYLVLNQLVLINLNISVKN